MKANPNGKTSLKWDTGFVVFAHGTQFLLLFLFFWLAQPYLHRHFRLTANIGPLPWFVHDLIGYPFVAHPVLTLVLSVVLLFFDAKVYARLPTSLGKRVAMLWASAVTIVLFALLIWPVTKALLYQSWMIDWRLPK